MATRPLSQAASAAGRKKRRLLPIVDARFQWKYTLWIMGLGAGSSAAMGGLVFNLARVNLRRLHLAHTPAVVAQLQAADRRLLGLIGAVVLGLTALLGVWGLIVTHRISGPVALASHYLKVVGEGRYPRVRPLRRKDELQGFITVMTTAINTLRHRDHVALHAAESLAAQLEAFQPPADEAGRAALAEAKRLVAQELGRLRYQLAPAKGEGSG